MDIAVISVDNWGIRFVADWTLLPGTILQRLGAEPAMLAVLMAGGVGATAIGASVQGQEEPGLPSAAEGAQPAPETEAAPSARPVILNQSVAPAGSLIAPPEGTALTIKREGAADAEAPKATAIVAEPVQATVLGPYDPNIAAAPERAAPPPAAEVNEADAAPVALAEAEEPEAGPDIARAASGDGPELLAQPGIEQAALNESSETNVDALGTEPAAAELALTAEQELPSEAAVADLVTVAQNVAEAVEPAEAVEELSTNEAHAEAPAAEVIVSEGAPQAAELVLTAELELPSESAAAELTIAAPETADVLELTTVEAVEPVVETAAVAPAPEEALRATEPSGQSSAFALAFADIAVPQPGPSIAPVPNSVAIPAEEPAQLTPAAAPASPIANVAFDLSAIPLPAEPGSAFVRTEGAAATGQGAQPAARAAPGNRYRLTGNGIEFRIPAVLFSEELGTVPLRIGSTNLVSVRLGDLLALVADRMDPAAHSRLVGSRQADEYVSFSTLRDAGIDLRYDAANDRLILGE